MSQHITRAYNKFIVDNKRGVISKFSKEERLKEEILYYEKIQNYERVKLFFPRYVLGDIHNIEKELQIEYFAYDNLGNAMVSSIFNIEFWQKIIAIISDSLYAFSSYSQNDNYSSLAKSMYIEKTEKYFLELKENFEDFTRLCNYEEIWINGLPYKNFEIIWGKIKDIINEKLLNLNKLNIIHGDFCFSNILFGINPQTKLHVIKFVDPRGRFGDLGIMGDPLYDYAKLRHSFEGGYEYIIYDKFKLTEELNNRFWFAFENDNRKNIQKIFQSYPEFNSLESKLIEGLIFIGMCSRHYDSLPRQKIMYCTGIQILNEVIKEYENMH
jgi:hypothetical protein